jgi:poly(A) polymerase
LRADCGEVASELADWWEDFALGSTEEREALIAAVREAQRGAPRRVSAPSAMPAPEANAEAADTVPGGEEGAAAPARKRRRRRRKPGGNAAPADAAAT